MVSTKKPALLRIVRLWMLLSMLETPARKLSDGTPRASLLIDYEHSGKYGLGMVVDAVAEELSGLYSDVYSPLKAWSSGFGFESKLEESVLTRCGVMRHIPGAITSTWDECEGMRTLAMNLSRYDKVYSIRAAPMIMAMSAWLTNFQNVFAKSLESYMEDPSSGCSDSATRNSEGNHHPNDSHREQTVARFNYERDLLAIGMLRHAFQIGVNRNMCKHPRSTSRFKSNMLFSFDLSRANEMMMTLDMIKDPTFNEADVMIEGSLVVNAEDYYGSDESSVPSIFRRIFMDTENIHSISIINDNHVIEYLGEDRTCKNLLMSSRKRKHGVPSDGSRDIGHLDQKQILVA